jgi:preprotein translocase subunit SecE
MTISKWVNLVFACVAILSFIVFDKALEWIWAVWGQSLPVDHQIIGSSLTLTTLLGLGMAVGLTLYLYRKPGTFSYMSEVVAELQRVTWPTMDETKRSTLVVIVFTILLSAYLAVFDWVWKIVTDFIISPGA